MEEAWELAALVMGKKDSTEIALGKDGVTFKTEGVASQRLANAALDFLSPISEGVGFLGTKLRGYRLEAALEATIKAKRICDDNGIDMKAISPKLFLNFVEAAAMEDSSSENNLINIYARLLASAAEGGNPNSVFYVGLIKQMTKVHAEFFEDICKGYSAEYFQTQAARVTEERISGLVEPCLRPHYKLGFANDEIDGVLEKIHSTLNIPNLHVFSFSAASKTKKTIKDHEFSIDFTARPIPRYSIVRESLEVLGLVKREFVETYAGGLEVTCHFVTLTDLGMDFVASCIAERKVKQ